MIIGELIGRGRTAQAYRVGEDRLVKLFLDGVESETVTHEFEISRAVHSLGLPTPLAHAIVEKDGRLGIVYDLVRGMTMTQLIVSRPGTLLKAARQLAEEHARIHQFSLPGLPSQLELLAEDITRAKLGLSLKQRILSLLRQLNTGDVLCHGDFHPDNVIISATGPIIIDWDTASSGHPLADVARTCVILSTAEIPRDTPLKPVLFLVRKLIHDAYVSHYLKLTGRSRQELNLWKIPVTAARLAEDIAGERDNLLRRLGDAMRQ